MSESKNLDHGLLFSEQGVQTADEAAYNSKIQPEFLKLGCQVKLILSTKRNDSFLLYNNIDPSDIDPEHNSLISNINEFFSNESNKLHVYLGIMCPRAELNFKDRKLEPSKELTNAVNTAIQHHNPYQELSKVFKTYGYFLPKSIILGHKAYRSCYLIMKDDSCQLLDQKDFDSVKYSNNNDILNQWEEYIRLHDPGTSTKDGNGIIMRDKNDFDTSFLTSINNDKIMKDGLEEWVKSCFESKIDSWKVISWKGLYPLYEIFDKELQKEIKSLLEIDDQAEKLKERVLLTGLIPIKDSTYHYHVKFSDHFGFNLSSDSYKIFGKLITQNGKSLDTSVIKFQSMSISGFSAIIENFYTNKKSTGSHITWIMIGIPSEIGYFSPHTRNISVQNLGCHLFKCNNIYKYPLDVPEDLPANSVVYVSVLHPSSHCGMKFTFQNEIGNGNIINIHLSNDDKNDSNT
ncbi:135_t:CDS:2 [Dentiscutata heterogama]|uniref:135_t:CDS:1 n=1 Tax=Dentiscutata heterogama TaxID=1316150 RepID=A0ACA9K0X6_9GLOM|nr:135_t:CDS:2 [Dentiscutata heterogama]